MARVEKLLQMMCHINFENESKQTMSLQSWYVIQKLQEMLRFLPELGQYEAGCTWKPGEPDFPDNRLFALMRYKCLEGGKLKDPEFRARYAVICAEWLEKGYVREVPECDWSLRRIEDCTGAIIQSYGKTRPPL